jgi:hypothetical protein
MDHTAKMDLDRDALELQRALLVVIIRRLDCVKVDIPLHRSTPEWRGLARRAFDDAVGDLARQLDRTGLVLERALRETVRALDDLAGRVR